MVTREGGKGALKCNWKKKKKIENELWHLPARAEIMLLCIQQFCDNSVGFVLHA